MSGYDEKSLKFDKLGPFKYSGFKRYLRSEKALKPACARCGTTKAYLIIFVQDSRQNQAPIGITCAEQLYKKDLLDTKP